MLPSLRRGGANLYLTRDENRYITLVLIGRIRGFGKFEVEAMGWILGGSLVVYWLAMILTGIFYMLTGVEISRLCRNRRKEVLGAFSQSLTITGWLLASLFLAPLGFLLAIQADVFLGSIFFNIAFLRQVRYIFRAETLTGQGLVVPHQSRKRYIAKES